ncbi:hypothetical protein Tco_1289937 [Tanacetum coccineum]
MRQYKCNSYRQRSQNYEGSQTLSKEIREVIKNRNIILNKVHTDDSVADPFTKLMQLTKHYEHALGIGLRRASSLIERRVKSPSKPVPVSQAEKSLQPLEFRVGKLVRTCSLVYLSSSELNLFSDQKDQYKEEVAEEMGEPTMEEYMTKNREDYGSCITRPKIDEKAHFELKGQFLKELHDNTFSGADNEDANEHIEKVLDIVDLFHILEVTQDQIML